MRSAAHLMVGMHDVYRVFSLVLKPVRIRPEQCSQQSNELFSKTQLGLQEPLSARVPHHYLEFLALSLSPALAALCL